MKNRENSDEICRKNLTNDELIGKKYTLMSANKPTNEKSRFLARDTPDLSARGVLPRYEIHRMDHDIKIVDMDYRPFSNRLAAPLPNIGSSSPAPPGFDNQLVPFSGRKSQLSSIQDYSEGTRMNQLEQRLSISERSNRALLEEVVRLQGELKQSHRKTEETLAAERQARQHLAENLRSSNDLIGQLGARLKRAEEKVQDERAAVGALVNHTKQVEQAVLGSQQEILSRRDQQYAKIADLRNDLDEANRMRDQLERATTTMVDEVRTLKSKVDTQQMEFNSIMHELKERSKRLEEDNRQAIVEARKHVDDRNFTEQEVSQLRLLMSSRLGEVRDALLDVRNRMTSEEAERRQNENQIHMRMNDMQAQVHEQARKRDEAMHALDQIQREREHATDNERVKMQGKIAEIAEEVSKKILQKEIKLREEAQQKFANVEKMLHAEQSARITHEQAMREENEKRWSALQKLTEDEVLNVREGHKLTSHKQTDGLIKVNDAIEMLEKQQSETKKQLEQVMKAEIKSRQLQDRHIEDKIEDVQEKLGVAIATLQQAIGGINEQVNEVSYSAQDKMKSLLDDQNQSGLRGLADLDARVMALNTKVQKQEELLDMKVAEALRTMEALKDERGVKRQTDTQSESLEDINDWRDSTDKILKELKEKMDDVGPEISDMNRTNEKVQEDMKGLVEQENKERTRDVQMVRHDLDTKHKQLRAEIAKLETQITNGGGTAAAPIPVSQKEKLSQGKKGKLDEETAERMELMEEDIKKINQRVDDLKEESDKTNESVQTVRSHLNVKIQNETKQTRKNIADLRILHEGLKKRVDDMDAGRSKISSPKPRDETPPPKEDSPPPKDDSPPPKNDSPPPKEDTPPPKKDTPPPKEDTPPPKEDSPPPKKDSPPPKADSPAPK
uniref:Coiled-coil domain-containing protein 154-like n=1 Tax=Saccoglossus kowalevskii TaxID=10224 RepID=A0ABM0M3T9_SACKO|nr:PREDICTED: coiled-coil domain-containing protein 154-like [Saccoglossus kowalevskii]